MHAIAGTEHELLRNRVQQALVSGLTTELFVPEDLSVALWERVWKSMEVHVSKSLDTPTILIRVLVYVYAGGGKDKERVQYQKHVPDSQNKVGQSAHFGYVIDEFVREAIPFLLIALSYEIEMIRRDL